PRAETRSTRGRRRRRAESGRSACQDAACRPRSLPVFPLLVPGHLDRLELRLVRRLGVIVEVLERQHALAKVGKPERERVDAWKLFGQGDADILGVDPFHGRTPCASDSLRSDFPSWIPPPSWT